MSSPTFSDALSYVVDAQAEILSAVADWKSYADAAAEAGVGWDRDREYWERHSLLFNAKELSAFEPVRRVLVDQLQFPASAIIKIF
jgi:hypothetical protein